MEEIKANAGEDFAERKAELEAEGLWAGENNQIMKLVIGNNYEKVTNPKTRSADGKHICSHRWAIFLSIDNDASLTKRFIKEVKYVLHPTYKVNKYTLTEAPFLLSRVAYGSFNVEVTVVFQQWTKQKPLKLNHMLEFVEGGKKSHRFIDSDSSRVNKNTSAAGSKLEQNTLAQIVKSLNDIEEENNKAGPACNTQ
jgi:transcription initiation factor IIF auxiliary subunit